MPPEWQEFRDRTTIMTVDGVNVNHFDEGEGDPLVLVHGGGLTSNAALNWGAVIDRFAEHFRVIALDQPGFGHTDPRGEVDYYPVERAKFLIEMIEEMGLEDVSLAGGSEGSTLVSHVALRRPDLVNGICLCNGGTIVREFGSPSPHARVEEPTMETVRADAEQLAEEYFTETKYHPFWNELTDEKIKYLYDLKKRNWEYNNARDEAIRETAWDYNRTLAYEGKPIARQPENFEVPLLFTWSTKPYFSIGYYDDQEGERNAGSPDATYEFFKQLDDAQMHIWQNSKHHTQTDKAPEFADVVTSFMKH